MSREPSETAPGVRASAEAEPEQQQQQHQPPPALVKKLEALPQLVQGLSSADSSLRLEAIKEFRELLSIERNSPIQEVVNSGAVPFFVELLSSDDFPQIQFEAVQALNCILNGTSEYTKMVIDQGAVPIFVKLLSSPSEDICEEAVWALGNVACHSPVFRDILLAHGVFLSLLQLLKRHPRLSLLRNSTWALSIICQAKPKLNFEHVKSALQILRSLIHSQDEEVLSAACWAYSFLLDVLVDSENIQALIDAGVCPRLVELLTHSSNSVNFPALTAVSKIANGDDAQIQCILDHQALPYFLNILINDKDKDEGRKGLVCWIIAQITATNKEQIQAVIDGNIIGPLVHLMQTAGLDVKGEAAQAISNAIAVGTPDQTKYLVSQGCIKAFCDLLVHESEIDMLTACLDGLKNILMVGEDMKSSGACDVNIYVRMIEDARGLFEIEDLEKHGDDTIYEKAVHLLVTFWPDMYEAPKRLMPAEVDDPQTDMDNSDGDVVDPPEGSN